MNTNSNIENLYHISIDPNLPNTLYPRQVDGMPEDAFEYELGPRVSFAPTIRQCAIAVYFNLVDNKKLTKNVIFYVYKLNTNKKLKMISREKIEELIADVAVTDEVCIIEPCPIKKIAKISVTFDGKKPLYAFYHNKNRLIGYEPIINVTEFYTNDVINMDGIVQHKKPLQ